MLSARARALKVGSKLKLKPPNIGTPMVVAPAITATILYDLVQCPQRVALDAFGDPSKRDPASPFVQLLWERGSTYEKEVIAGLAFPFLDLSHLAPGEREAATMEAMRRGEQLIYAGRISADGLVGLPDLLRKSGLGYQPGDIKSGAAEEVGGGEDDDGKPKKHYAVQLALYVDILERLGLSAGRFPFVWDVHGREVIYELDAPQGPRNPQSLWDVYSSALAEARAILSRALVPKAASSATCKLCRWYNHCLAELTRAGDLTLIPRLGRKARDSLALNFSNISELSAANPEAFLRSKNKSQFEGIGPDTLRKFIERARLLDSSHPQPYLTAAVALPTAPLELFFDVEVDPMRDVCYLHGIVERRDGNNATERFVGFFAEVATPEAEKRAFAEAMEYFRTARPSVIYYYSKYERTIYRKLQARFPDVCTREKVEELFDPARAIDLYNDVVTRFTEWPTHDHSIKTLAKYLGFAWRVAHPSGAASIEWFHRWTARNDPAIRQRILDYNEDDCRATRVVLDVVRGLA